MPPFSVCDGGGGGRGWRGGVGIGRRGRTVTAVDSGWTGCARFESRFRHCSRPHSSECHFTGQLHGVSSGRCRGSRLRTMPRGSPQDDAEGVASGRCRGGRLRTMPRGRRSPCAMWVKPHGWGKPLSRQNSVHLFLFYRPFCFTFTEARMLIRDRDGDGGGVGGWGGEGQSVKARPRTPPEKDRRDRGPPPEQWKC